MLGFGCKVIAFDIQKSEELIAKGIEYKPNLSKLTVNQLVGRLFLGAELKWDLDLGQIPKEKIMR